MRIRQQSAQLVLFLVVGNKNNEIFYYNAMHIEFENLNFYRVKLKHSIFSL